jgi:tRNA/tmRNA/rRNA uracil-C5-methylase (TrmA/RlmC/RlmD family)
MREIVLTVDKPANDGTCVGRSEGRVVFVAHALPGETVRARVLQGEEGSRFWRAEAVEVLEAPAQHRVPSPCEWFRPGGCGGCAWLHAEPAVARTLKAQVLAETLRRIGGVDREVTVRSLGRESGWRTRVTLHVDQQGRAGFYRGRSHDVVPVGHCLQADPALALDDLLAATWPPGSTVHASLSEAGRAVIVTGTDAGNSGPDEHVDHVGGRPFLRAADGFWQSHRDAPRVLAEEVAVLAELQSADAALDLYAGVGLFGLTLLDRCDPASVTLVEGDRVAARYARRNAADDPRVKLVSRDMRTWSRRPGTADVVVLDPPRAGAGKQVVTAVAATGARTVVYVSCDPATLARDLKTFAGVGYRVDHLEGFDVFPGTAHVETVVRLRAD